MQNSRALGAPPPDPRASGGWGLCLQTPSLRQMGALPPNPQPPADGGFAPKPPVSGGWGLHPQIPIGLRPQTPKQNPIANFWLRAWERLFYLF